MCLTRVAVGTSDSWYVCLGQGQIRSLDCFQVVSDLIRDECFRHHTFMIVL